MRTFYLSATYLCLALSIPCNHAQETSAEQAVETQQEAAAQPPAVSPDAYAAFEEGVQKYTGIGSSARDTAAAAAAFRKAAEQGMLPAAFAYGICCRRGYGVEKNPAEAARWFRTAAEQGYAPAQAYLGVLYAAGEGVEKDMAEAVRLYRLAAEQGFALAQMKLGYLHSEGSGVDVDLQKAIAFYEQAAQAGHSTAQNNLGWAYMNGLGVKENYEKAIHWLEKAAAQGQMNALVNLGRCYERCISISDNTEEKIYQLYRQAAEQGFEAGIELVGECYSNGLGVEENAKAAALWLRAAADQGNRFAQYELGVLYEDANGVNYDPKEAVRLYRLSAEQKNPNGMVWYARCCMDGVGDAKADGEEIFRLISEGLELGECFPYAMTLLGECYEKGIGTPKNPVKARELYRKAEQGLSEDRIHRNLYRSLYLGIGGEADIDELIDIWQEEVDAGSASAMNELGVCYELGEGMEKDLKEAAAWYSRAVKKQDPVARYNLARCYWWGIGVEQDRKKAAELYAQSANKAFKPAMEAYAKIGLKLSPVFKNKRYYSQVPIGPREPAPNAPDPEGTEPLRSFLCGDEFYAWDDIPYKPSYELIDPSEKPVAAEDMPPEKTTKQISEELVSAGDVLWATGHKEEAIARFRQAAEKWDNEARLRLALCAFTGLGMPHDPKAAQQYIADALNSDSDMAAVLAEYIKTATK